MSNEMSGGTSAQAYDMQNADQALQSPVTNNGLGSDIGSIENLQNAGTLSQSGAQKAYHMRNVRT